MWLSDSGLVASCPCHRQVARHWTQPAVARTPYHRPVSPMAGRRCIWTMPRWCRVCESNTPSQRRRFYRPPRLHNDITRLDWRVVPSGVGDDEQGPFATRHARVLAITIHVSSDYSVLRVRKERGADYLVLVRTPRLVSCYVRHPCLHMMPLGVLVRIRACEHAGVLAVGAELGILGHECLPRRFRVRVDAGLPLRRS